MCRYSYLVAKRQNGVSQAAINYSTCTGAPLTQDQLKRKTNENAWPGDGQVRRAALEEIGQLTGEEEGRGRMRFMEI